MVPSPFACARGAQSPETKNEKNMFNKIIILFVLFLIVHFTLLLKGGVIESPIIFYILVAVELVVVSLLVLICNIKEEDK